MCYTLESCAPFSVKICEQTPHFLAMHLKHVSQSWLRFMCRLLHRNKEKSNHFPCSSKTACKTRPPILFLKSTMGPCIQSKERERSAPLEAWMFRGLVASLLPCLQLCHNGPRLSQVLLSFPAYCFRTHRHAIYMAVCNYDFLTKAWPVIFTHMEAVWSLVVALTMQIPHDLIRDKT